jgi:hypothetical protein
MQVQRVLNRYLKDADELQGEIDVTHIPFKVLTELFHPPADDPLMFNVYNLNSAQAMVLQPYLSERLDLDQYEYQIEAYQA